LSKRKNAKIIDVNRFLYYSTKRPMEVIMKGKYIIESVDGKPEEIFMVDTKTNKVTTYKKSEEFVVESIALCNGKRLPQVPWQEKTHYHQGVKIKIGPGVRDFFVIEDAIIYKQD